MTIDYIYIGPRSTAPTTVKNNDYLLFDFKNGEADRNRYVNDPAYGTKNYDLASNWSTNAEYSTAPVIDTAAGTLHLGLANNDRTSLWYQTNPDPQYNYAMSYQPESDHYIYMRLRFNDMTASGTPYIRFAYYIGTDIWEGNTATDKKECPYYLDDYNLTANQITSGEFITIRIPICRTNNTVHSNWTNVRMIIGNITSASTEALDSIDVDYIYFGPSEIIPAEESAANSLYFSFENSSVDQARYANNTVYGGNNYDLASNWSTNMDYSTVPVIDPATGTLHLGLANNKRTGLWYQTNPDPQYNFALSYRPASDHYIYMRLRFNDMKASGTPYIRFTYYIGKDIFEGDTSSNKAERPYNLDDYFLTADQVTSGEFITLKIPICRTNNTIHDKWTNIRMIISDITSASTEVLGSIDVDYIYFGPSAPIPTNESTGDSLYFDFKNSEVDQERYAEDPVYGGNNYDDPANMAVNWQTSTAIVDKQLIDNTSGQMQFVGKTMGVNAWPSYYFNMARTLDFNTSEAQYFEMRFKLENFDMGEYIDKETQQLKKLTPYFTLGCFENSGNDTVTNIFKDYLIDTEHIDDGKYMVIKMDIPASSDCHKITSFTALRLYFGGIESNLTEFDELGIITIDYIFLGKKADLEKVRTENRRNWQTVTDGTTADHKQDQDIKSLANAIFFDFNNSPTDRVRYSADTYCNTNWDDPNGKHWFDASMAASSGNSAQSAVMDNTSGTLSLTPKTGATQTWTEVTISGSTADVGSSLQFDPAYLKVFQVRFKVDGLTASGNPVVRLQLHRSNGALESNRVSVSFDSGHIGSDSYLVLTGSLGSSLDGYETITGMRINFANLKNTNDSAPGKITIDYIYVGPEETLPSNITYGYDSSYLDDSKLSNGSSLFTEGRGIPLMKSNLSIDFYSAFTETAFTFTGTGFDLIGRTGADQGAIRVAVFDSNGYCVKVAQVLNKSDLGTELMQIPVLSIETKKHDTYYVKIFVAAPFDYGEDGCADDFEGTLDRGGEFFFDAIRVYNPIDTASASADATAAHTLYQKHGEADPEYYEIRNMLIDAKSFNEDGGGSYIGTVYLDAAIKEGVSFEDDTLLLRVAEYKEIGPNNEVYLAKGNAIAFKLAVTGTLPSSIDIGAKSADGKPVKLVTRVNTAAAHDLPTGAGYDITSATAQFYPLSNSTWNWVVSGTERHVYVTIYNAGDGILSITDIKCAYDEAKSQVSRYIRFLVDREMLDDLNICYEHAYAYTDNGENHTICCDNCSYSITEGHTFEEGECICGATQNVGSKEVYVDDLKAIMSISVGAEMSVGFTVMSSVVSKYDTFYLAVEKAAVGGEKKTAIFGFEEGHEAFHALPSNETPFLFNASFSGLTAKEMGDKIHATLYAVDADGTVYFGPTQVDSVKDYLMRGLDLATSTDAKKTMYVDMLRYGAVAQTYFQYDTENLVDADLTEAHMAYATMETPEAVDNSKAEGGLGTLNTSVVLKARVTLTLSHLKPGANLANMKFIVKDALDGTVIKELPAYNLNPVMIAADFDDVGAKQMRRLITVTLYDGDTAITDTVTWSVESYVAKTRATSTDAGQIDLVNAMLTYGDAVAAYMATQ